MKTKLLRSLMILIFGAILISCGGSSDVGSGVSGSPASATPNILFVIMDDVGIDQMKSFGYGGPIPPNMPNMTAVANGGVLYHGILNS